MAGALIANCSTTGLFRDESAYSTSCRASQSSFAPQSGVRFAPLLPAILSRHRSARAQGLSVVSEPRLLCRSGLSIFSSWNGRSHLGQIVRVFEGRPCSVSSRRGIAGRVRASLLGVGAPEALVIAVVALVVFGPKGLAQLARSLGQSLKAFQPTIQELQQVSREFKNTLEQEIGLDDLRNSQANNVPPTFQRAPPQQQPPQQQEAQQQEAQLQEAQQQPPQQEQAQNGTQDARAYTANDYMRVTQEQAKALVPEDLRRASEAAAWGSMAPPKIPTNIETKEVSEPEKSKSDE